MSEIPGLPNLSILTDAVNEMIKRSAWDVEVEELSKLYKYYEPGSLFELTMKPKSVVNVVRHVSKRGRETFFDKEIAEIVEDVEFGRDHAKIKAGTGYSEKMPAKEEAGMLYRGVSWEEYQFIKKHGFIKSNCSYNLGECQLGLTYFSGDPDTAAHYAGTFQPYPWLPTFERPAYVIKIRRPSEEKIDLTAAPMGEIGIRGDIPVSEIVALYEIRPYEISPGKVELRKVWYGDKEVFIEGSRMSPDIHVAYREVSTNNPNPYLSDVPLHSRGKTMPEEEKPSKEPEVERFRLVGKNLPAEMREVIRELGNEMPIDFVEIEGKEKGEPELVIETRCGSSKIVGSADKARLVGELSVVSCEAVERRQRQEVVKKEEEVILSEEKKE